MYWFKNCGDLSDKIAIVTGGNSGIGFENCRMFAKLNVNIIMAVRSIERGNIAKQKILKEFSNAKIVVSKLDLSSLNSVEEFANWFSSNYNKLDILINNAGIMVTPYKLTVDGYEEQFAVNYLGHFALTARLFEILKKTPKSRVINLSSIAHHKAVIDINNINYNNGEDYKPMIAYRRSKLATLLFSYELAKRVKENDLDIKVIAAHPGITKTNLGKKDENGRIYRFVIKLGMILIAQNSFYGSLPTLRAAIDEYASNGEFYGPNGKNEWEGEPVLVKEKNKTINDQLMTSLFNYSEEITGLKFDFKK